MKKILNIITAAFAAVILFAAAAINIGAGFNNGNSLSETLENEATKNGENDSDETADTSAKTVSGTPDEIEDEDSTAINAVITQGEKLLGTPYEYGSERLLDYDGSFNPAFSGETFDCSAFIQYIFYKGAKIKLYGDSRSMSTQGKDVAFNALQKGDVIFMTSSSRLDNTGIERIGHVALYIGDNRIMHTFGTGGVRIQVFSEFWRERYIKAKRMV